MLYQDHVLAGFDEIKDVTSVVVCLAPDFDTGVDVAQRHVRARDRGAVFVGDCTLHFAAIVLRHDEGCTQENQYEGSKRKPVFRRSHVQPPKSKKKGSWATWVVRLEPTPTHTMQKGIALILIPRNGIH